MKSSVFNFLFVLIILFFWGCSEFDSNPKGLLNLILIDTPAQWDSVFVEVQGVDVELIRSGREDGMIETFFLPYAPGDKKIEVSSLVGGEALLLGRDELPNGKVLGLTMRLGDEYFLYLDEKRYSMSLAESASNEVPIEIELDIEQGFSYDIILDFDLEKSIKVIGEAPLSLELNPIIKAYKGAGTGEITGVVSPTSLQPAVYAILDGDSISTHTNSSGTYNFRLPEGTYSLYFDPKNESFADTLIHNVEVVARETNSLDLVNLKLKP